MFGVQLVHRRDFALAPRDVVQQSLVDAFVQLRLLVIGQQLFGVVQRALGDLDRAFGLPLLDRVIVEQSSA